jgi:AcrB/AcrD/AcrF family
MQYRSAASTEFCRGALLKPCVFRPRGGPCLGHSLKPSDLPQSKQIQDRDRKDSFAAAVEAGRLRLRPILMTSFALIFGVPPACEKRYGFVGPLD